MAIFFNEFKHLKIQLEEIKSATDNFGDNNLIGRGGFGKVYKGTISHSKGQIMAAAFKRLDSALGQGNSEFWKEITMLSRYTHENLVSLLGYCDVGDEKILVYEYASRGSLDRHLSDTGLTWMQRLRICLGAARGLSYLHDPKGTQQRVLHRDIKSSNILLDENWNAKVSDFGLSRVSPANQEHTILISNMVGTVGYLDPLYLEMGLLTKESDVYSFGVVLFEVLCGRLCYEYSNSRVQTLVRLWKKSYKQKRLDEIIFQDMFQQMDPSSLETFSDISYLCLNKSLEERPMMAHVVKELEIALDHQVTYEQRIDNAEMNRNNQPCFSGRTEVPPPLIYSPKEEPEMLLSKGNLLHMDKAEDNGRRLPKFGEWDADDHLASVEGFTAIFNDEHMGESMSRIKHFSHEEHPLKLIESWEIVAVGDDNDEKKQVVCCYGCREPILGGFAYGCTSCSHFLHEKCANLAPVIDHHLHPEHPLTLIVRDVNGWYCDVCDTRGLGKGFSYWCMSCDFDACTKCGPAIALEHEAAIALKQEALIKLKHEGHPQHTLTLQLRSASFYCDACQAKDEDLFYHCDSCDFWMHKTCASLAPTINLSHHPNHPLVLVYSLPDNFYKFFFGCQLCNKRIQKNGWLYYCASCRYFAHIKCALNAEQPSIPSDSVGTSLVEEHVNECLHFPMSDAFTDPLKLLHLDKASLDDDGATEISH